MREYMQPYMERRRRSVALEHLGLPDVPAARDYVLAQFERL